MSTFFQKNKKKSALAALLLFIRTRKTVTALLLLVALASFLFVSPSNFLLHLPGGDRVVAGVAWIAGKMGVDTSKWGLGDTQRDYGDLLAAFRAAKENGNKAGWAAFMRGGAGGGRGGAGGADGTGSLGFVKGSAKDLEATGGDDAKLPKPGTVGGVLNPDDASNRAEGDAVALSDEDLGGEREGLVKSAFAGGFGSGSAFGNNGFGSGFGSGFGGSGSGSGGLLSGGAYASNGFFGDGKGAVSGKLGDVVKNGLEGIEGQTAKGVEIKGAGKGKLSSTRANAIQARTSRGLVGTRTISGQRAFVQLAAGRGRAAISVAPNCTAATGCPGEFASVNTGAVYDGNTISGERTDIITTGMDFDGDGELNLPDTSMADDYVRQAEKMNADAEKCRELDEKYGPQELAYDQQQEELSNRFDSMGCGQGGCSKSKAKKCQRLGDEMKSLCRASMGVRCKHIHECPLTANNNCSPSECDGPARNKSKVVDVNDGIRSTTMDQGEQTAECTSSKQGVESARQSAQNALNAYRNSGCEAKQGSLTYALSCYGPENQVINTCKNYGHALCSASQACNGGQCTGETDQCVITDLNGIETFISK